MIYFLYSSSIYQCSACSHPVNWSLLYLLADEKAHLSILQNDEFHRDPEVAKLSSYMTSGQEGDDDGGQRTFWDKVSIYGHVCPDSLEMSIHVGQIKYYPFISRYQDRDRQGRVNYYKNDRRIIFFSHHL